MVRQGRRRNLKSLCREIQEKVYKMAAGHGLSTHVNIVHPEDEVRVQFLAEVLAHGLVPVDLIIQVEVVRHISNLNNNNNN